MCCIVLGPLQHVATALFIHLYCMVANWNWCFIKSSVWHAINLQLIFNNIHVYFSFSSRPTDPEFMTGWPEKQQINLVLTDSTHMYFSSQSYNFLVETLVQNQVLSMYSINLCFQ